MYMKSFLFGHAKPTNTLLFLGVRDSKQGVLTICQNNPVGTSVD